MAIALSQSVTAIGPGPTAGFLASGGVAPYVYSVIVGGAGGTINSSTGVYHPPGVVNSDPSKAYDTIQVIDSLSAIATAQILVTTPLGLVCDIIQNQMNLAVGRVFLWDQKIFDPIDNDIYVVVGVLREKPFGNVIEFNGAGSGLAGMQYCNVMTTLSIDAISRGPAARDRKEEIIMAFMSVYAQQQMEANSFSIGRIPVGFINLSIQDGAAIPYRFNINVNVQYTVAKTVSVPYFDTFVQPSVTVNP